MKTPTHRHRPSRSVAPLAEQPLAARLRVPSRRLGLALACLSLVLLVAMRSQGVFTGILDGVAAWNTAQEQAVTSLGTYAASAPPHAYAQYRASMATLDAFQRAREQMLAHRPVAETQATLAAAGIHAPSSRWTLLAFAWLNHAPNLHAAVRAWRAADAPLQSLASQAAYLHLAYAAGRPAPSILARHIAAINAIGRQVARTGALFSIATARAVITAGRMLYVTVLLLAMAVVVLWFLLSRGILAGARADHERMRHLATHEPLTGLANRKEFVHCCTQALAAARAGSSQVAVMFIDLDGFKDINDRLGHASGDDLLRLVAQRITGVLRHGDLAARLGGDEFAVLQTGVTSDADVTCLAKRLSSALSAPCRTTGEAAGFGASIGVAMSHGETDAETLLACADQAMYLAKRNKPNAWRLFQPTLPPAPSPPATPAPPQPFAHSCQA